MTMENIFLVAFVASISCVFSFGISFLNMKRYTRKYLAQLDKLQKDVDEFTGARAELSAIATESLRLVESVVAAMKDDEQLREKLLDVIEPHLAELDRLKEKTLAR